MTTHRTLQAPLMGLRDSSWVLLIEALETLKRLDKRILFIANPGNAGDALIASATWQVFDRVGLRVRAARTRDIHRDDIVIYGGGGNLVPMYPAARSAIERALAVDAAQLMLLPHTVRGHEDLLQRLDRRFTFFCRDQVGLEHVRRSAPSAQAHFCPDMALALDVTQLRERAASLVVKARARWVILTTRRHRRYSGWQEATRALYPDVDGRLVVLRSDVEALGLPASKAVDLSGMYGSALRYRDECDVISARFLDVIDRAKTVRTDRLHVAIASQLLGKPVELLDNSYGKNHAVASACQHLLPLVRLVHGDSTR